MAYTRRQTQDGVTVMNKDLYDNLQDGIEQFGVTPQMFGAIGDGVHDDTEAFIKAQESNHDVFVPNGIYLLENFVFDRCKKWTFGSGDKTYWWQNCKIITSTGIVIKRANIDGLVVVYNGEENPKNRCDGIIIDGSYMVLNRVYVDGFYNGVHMGSSEHTCYVTINNLYSYHNYKYGLFLDGSQNHQINFLTFNDCNIGANGEGYFEYELEPTEGYGTGIYIAGGNSLVFNNVDISANSEYGVYITDKNQSCVSVIFNSIYSEDCKKAHVCTDLSNDATRNINILGAFYNSARVQGHSYYQGDEISLGSISYLKSYSKRNINLSSNKYLNIVAISNDITNDCFNVQGFANSRGNTFLGIQPSKYDNEHINVFEVDNSQFSKLVSVSGYVEEESTYILSFKAKSLDNSSNQIMFQSVRYIAAKKIPGSNIRIENEPVVNQRVVIGNEWTDIKIILSVPKGCNFLSLGSYFEKYNSKILVSGLKCNKLEKSNFFGAPSGVYNIGDQLFNTKTNKPMWYSESGWIYSDGSSVD